jgi:hypothetical protein
LLRATSGDPGSPPKLRIARIFVVEFAASFCRLADRAARTGALGGFGALRVEGFDKEFATLEDF